MARGDVAPMHVAGGAPCDVTCPDADIGHATPIISDMHTTATAMTRNIDCRAMTLFEQIRFCMCCAPAELPSAENRELREHRYFRNARAAVWTHEEGSCQMAETKGLQLSPQRGSRVGELDALRVDQPVVLRERRSNHRPNVVGRARASERRCLHGVLSLSSNAAWIDRERRV